MGPKANYALTFKLGHSCGADQLVELKEKDCRYRSSGLKWSLNTISHKCSKGPVQTVYVLKDFDGLAIPVQEKLGKHSRFNRST